MSSNLAAVVRITTKRRAVWRACAACGDLAALAPRETHCPPCCEQATTPRRRAA
ncbi:hypothetical protein GCM10009682_11000 [Luedemannella flava]|uniref:DUF35 domain-containing protein n=1 Tax=Luedemannella flava TaxID=349316 RepID=A0ABN2LJH9_9ACTN